MPHTQVETFFHEFGHVMHHMLSHAELSTQTGFGVSLDFVEAPSQMLENWAWEYESLKLFAKHFETGEVLPRELHDRMIAAKNVGSGNNNLAQVFYGIIDFTFYDGYDPSEDETTTDIVKRLQNQILLYPYVEGTHFHAAFGHLYEYAAGYYGYLWAKVYAEDMFSIFKENGLMDQKTGLRYRDIILARGATMDELEMVKEFLGREPMQLAFLESLGL
jgi:thimet oligopeptidase